jgi:hypothetical protein
MQTTQDDMQEFRASLAQGALPRAYGALIAYMGRLGKDLKTLVPGATVSSFYQGALDISFITLHTPALKQRKLKLLVVFNYSAFRFEAWLAGVNRGAQREYCELFAKGDWPDYRVSTPAKDVHSILECDLVADVHMGDMSAMTETIETTTLAFLDDIAGFLSDA